MNVAIFTGNSFRHRSFVDKLAETFERVYCISEFPLPVRTQEAQPQALVKYFELVGSYEREIFNTEFSCRPNLSVLEIPYGRLPDYETEILSYVDLSDVIIVFGSSYIRGRLAHTLISRACINLHMGVSPYFRGSACNYWAIRLGRLDLIGATIHRLGYGIDSGDIFFHALPRPYSCNPLKLSMLAVKSAQLGLIHRLSNSDFKSWSSVPQDGKRGINYSRISDFGCDQAEWYFNNDFHDADSLAALESRSESLFVNPIII